MVTASPDWIARTTYGARVAKRAAGVLLARFGGAIAAPPVAASPVPFNTMFAASRLPAFARERATLEAFDLYLYDVMNSPRLEGQIVFEYGTLLRAVDRWEGLRVLDVGTGRSTLPAWMSSVNASVTTFDLSAPAEAGMGGFEERVNRIVARDRGTMHAVSGSMRRLPFADASFDLVTSLSVVEHLDTDLPGRAYVPYDEQRARLRTVLDECLRVTKPHGRIYITSDCCDFERATIDHWRNAYYYDAGGPALSGAWPATDVPELFYEYLASRGCDLLGGVQYRPAEIAAPDHWTWRGPFFGGFSVLAEKR